MKRYLNQLFISLFLLFAGIILLICFTGTFHDISVFCIFFISCAWLAAFFLLFFLLQKWEKKLAMMPDKWVVLFLIVWGGYFIFIWPLYKRGAFQRLLVYPRILFRLGQS